jgi:hypothetical protein
VKLLFATSGSKLHKCDLGDYGYTEGVEMDAPTSECATAGGGMIDKLSALFREESDDDIRWLIDLHTFAASPTRHAGWVEFADQVIWILPSQQPRSVFTDEIQRIIFDESVIQHNEKTAIVQMENDRRTCVIDAYAAATKCVLMNFAVDEYAVPKPLTHLMEIVDIVTDVIADNFVKDESFVRFKERLSMSNKNE